MKNFTDDEMNALLPTAKADSVVIHLRGARLPWISRRLAAVATLRRDRRQCRKLRENLL